MEFDLLDDIERAKNGNPYTPPGYKIVRELIVPRDENDNLEWAKAYHKWEVKEE